MRKIFLLTALLSAGPVSLLACPFCGCGNSNFQIGLLPTYTNAFVGVRYTYTHFNTLSSDGDQFSHDYFHTTEIWGGYKAGKFQVMAFVPYVVSHKSSDDGIIDNAGLGDVLLLSNYQIFSFDEPKNGKAYNNTLWLGGGIKFKTGASEVDVTDPAFTVGDFTSTPGTGSTDFLLNASHNLVMGNNGIVTNVAYRINGTNAQDFRYGNRLYLNTAYFHSWPVGVLVVRPQAGLNLVMNEMNRYQGQDVTGSDGYVLSGNLGVNVQWNKVGLLANGFLPLSQDLFNYQTSFESRAMVALTYSF